MRKTASRVTGWSGVTGGQAPDHGADRTPPREGNGDGGGGGGVVVAELLSQVGVMARDSSGVGGGGMAVIMLVLVFLAKCLCLESRMIVVGVPDVAVGMTVRVARQMHLGISTVMMRH